MSANTDTYSDISKRLTDILDVEGGEVDDLTLDLLNRAQRELRMYRKWEELRKQADLTVTACVAPIPTDCGEILRIGLDTNDNGRLDTFYYQDSFNSIDGYKVTNTWTKAAGHSQTITFFTDPNYTPVIDYIRTIDDFEGSGTEYSFFPGDLLIARAHKIYLSEMGVLNPAEYNVVASRERELMIDYEQAHQFVNVAMVREIKDDAGRAIDMESYSLMGGSDGGPTTLDPDVDTRD